VGVAEKQTLDMSAILLLAYELSDMIKHSAAVAEYLYWKQEMERDESARQAIARFRRAKEKFEEAERFGHFHPNYHEALEQAKQAQRELENIEAVRNFKRCEEELDDLLYEVSRTIAHSVSESIKVPSDKLDLKGCGCGAGGGCSGGCG
jgi:cell fate (sporulation/competence/biofilm development) regulator YlbF (YheA/YmcA/DUF963 family)